MKRWRVMKNLLWVDSTAGLFVGMAVLLLSEWLTSLYALPRGLLLFTAVANVIYGAYSLTLAVRPVRSRRSIEVLVFANGAWAVMCCALASIFVRSATILGMGHLLVEAVFVAALARLEWTGRDTIATPAPLRRTGTDEAESLRSET